MYIRPFVIAGLNGMEFSVKSGDYKDLMRSSSVDMIDNLEEDCNSYHSRMLLSYL